MSHYTVGELANHLGVTVRTLQYYDRKGLLTAERASESNRRYYNDAHTTITVNILIETIRLYIG